MLFNSYLFVFVFLPAVLLLWYGLNAVGQPRLAQTALVGMSLWFYGYGHPEYILLILASVLGNFMVSWLMEAVGGYWKENSRARVVLGCAGILFNVGLLFYFKYYDFFVRNVNRLLDTGWEIKNIALPLGISFFTFQQISFVADRMQGRAAHYSMLDYLNYVTFFPQLVAGPIVNHRDLAPQFARIGQGRAGISWKDAGMWERLERGICLFIVGLAKKVLLADKLGVVVDYGYADVGSLDGISAFLVMLSYTFQIYFDFSGYCDMAVGLGWMLQIELPKNFDSPYHSVSVKEFWKRWHMTLNAFFTQYIYIPLGGGRQGLWKKLRNTMIVFFISGIWHGAAWSFVVWGMAHGVMLCIEQLFSEKIFRGKAASFQGHPFVRSVRWLYTFLFVNLAWVLFRSGSLPVAQQFYKRLFSFSYTGKMWELAARMEGSWNYLAGTFWEQYWGAESVRILYLVLFLALLALAGILCCGKNAYEWVCKKEASVGRLWFLAFLFALSVISFSGVTTFLYFNF